MRGGDIEPGGAAEPPRGAGDRPPASEPPPVPELDVDAALAAWRRDRSVARASDGGPWSRVGLWLALTCVYVALLGLPSADGSDLAGDEPYHLLVAESIVADRDLDIADQLAERAYEPWGVAGTLAPRGEPVLGRQMDPVGLGFPLLLAPLHALGGPLAVDLGLAAIAALAFTLAAALARRLVREPWASGGVLVVAISPPALGAATTIGPGAVAAALLAGAAVLALRVRTVPRTIWSYASAAMLAVLPWLDPLLIVPALVVATPLVRWLVRWRRRLVALVCAEILLMSAVVYITVNEPLYGGITPDAAASGEGAIGAASLMAVLERAWRVVAAWIDRDIGLLRWAPFLALAWYAGWMLWRSRRDLVARLFPDRLEVETTASVLLGVAGGVLLAVAFAATAFPAHGTPPGYALAPALPALAALSAWGWSRAPRTGTALAAVTLAASVWLYVALRSGDGSWTAPPAQVPFGPLRDALPTFAAAEPLTIAWTAAAGAALAGLVAYEWWRYRRG